MGRLDRLVGRLFDRLLATIFQGKLHKCNQNHPIHCVLKFPISRRVWIKIEDLARVDKACFYSMFEGTVLLFLLIKC